MWLKEEPGHNVGGKADWTEKEPKSSPVSMTLTLLVPNALFVPMLAPTLLVLVFVFTLLLAAQSIPTELELLINVFILELARSPLLVIAEHILSLSERIAIEMYSNFVLYQTND